MQHSTYHIYDFLSVCHRK